MYNFRAKVKASKSNVDDVAVVDEAFMTEYKDFSLQHAISNIEDQLQTDVFQDDEHDDVMPQAAQDMGSGIIWSFLTSHAYLAMLQSLGTKGVVVLSMMPSNIQWRGVLLIWIIQFNRY